MDHAVEKITSNVCILHNQVARPLLSDGVGDLMVFGIANKRRSNFLGILSEQKALADAGLAREKPVAIGSSEPLQVVAAADQR